MKKNIRASINPAGHRGFVLPMVLFLIVVLAGAAVAISQLTIDTTASNLQAVQKTRADLFNQSLIDVAVHELVTSGTCSSTSTYTHPDFPGLEATLTCTSSDYTTATTGNFELWTVRATAESVGPEPNEEEYVWRRMTSIVELEIP